MSHTNHSHNCSQHNHNHSHNHNDNHSNPQPKMSNKEYFNNLYEVFNNERTLFFGQLFEGQPLSRVLSYCYLDTLKFTTIYYYLSELQQMISAFYPPLRQFVSSLLIPSLILFFINYLIVVGMDGCDRVMYTMMAASAVIFVVFALKGNGDLSQFKSQSIEVLSVRPYLNQPQGYCKKCSLIKILRSVHCPMCDVCVPKFSCHSLAMGTCIGAGNQLLAISWFGLFTLTQYYTIFAFYLNTNYSFLTQLLFYGINLQIAWLSLSTFISFFVLVSLPITQNVVYGITWYEVRMWPKLIYLHQMQNKGFKNYLDNGVLHNLLQSTYALVQCEGVECNPYYKLTTNNMYNFPQVTKIETVNWNKAFFYMLPSMVNHFNRTKSIAMIRRDEPRIIATFTLHKRLKLEVETENPNFTEQEVMQRVMAKMREHIQPPTAQEQMQMQLNAIRHLRNNAQGNYKAKLLQIEEKLISKEKTPLEINQLLRQLQLEIIKNSVVRAEKKQDEEEGLKKHIYDQDL